MEIEKLDWNAFGRLVAKLAADVRRIFKPQVVVGVGRSGLIPAAILARELGVSEFYSIVVRLYSDEKPPRKLHAEPQVLFSNLKGLQGKRVLLVDDFANTGSTISRVVSLIKTGEPSETRTAVVALRSDAKIKPDYYAKVFGGCIIFPWDLEPHRTS